MLINYVWCYEEIVYFSELYEYCLNENIADKNLIAKWKKQGYENLCCLRCIQTRDTNFGTSCICRVPKGKLEEVSEMCNSLWHYAFCIKPINKKYIKAKCCFLLHYCRSLVLIGLLINDHVLGTVVLKQYTKTNPTIQGSTPSLF